MSWWGWALIGNSLIGLSVLLHRRGRRKSAARERRPEPVGLAGWCEHGVGMLDECDECVAERRAGAGDGRG